jgi:hypothetical protein
VGVDTKKAFHSADHNYMLGELEAYEFGPKFISWRKLQNKDLKADLLVNGVRTDKISIEQLVKQGGTMSSSLFILCMDPLLEKSIKTITFKA